MYVTYFTYISLCMVMLWSVQVSRRCYIFIAQCLASYKSHIQNTCNITAKTMKIAYYYNYYRNDMQYVNT